VIGSLALRYIQDFPQIFYPDPQAAQKGLTKAQTAFSTRNNFRPQKTLRFRLDEKTTPVWLGHFAENSG